MAQQQINVGVSANDGGGDALRDAFIKSNSNATDAEARLLILESPTVQSVSGTNETHIVTDTLVVCDTSSNDVEIAILPVAQWVGKILNIKKALSANKIIINPDGTEQIEGASTYEFVQMGESLTIMSDGTGVLIV